jgi:nitroimidazol reductase NimA-like FMN-containing flavoprotein (pyridoxamine 5'-phosphate oxidase superfamily)
MAAADHEIVSIYPFSEAQIDALMTHGRECVLMWGTKDGWPVGVTHAFVWHDGHVWITFAAHRHRAAAIRRDPRVSVVVSGRSNDAPECPNGSATMKGRAIFHDDRETKEWFYKALSTKNRPDKESQERFYEILDSPLRVILEVVPEKWITFDSDKSARDREGTLGEDEKGPRLSADAVLMNRERQRRGLEPR